MTTGAKWNLRANVTSPERFRTSGILTAHEIARAARRSPNISQVFPTPTRTRTHVPVGLPAKDFARKGLFIVPLEAPHFPTWCTSGLLGPSGVRRVTPVVPLWRGIRCSVAYLGDEERRRRSRFRYGRNHRSGTEGMYRRLRAAAPRRQVLHAPASGAGEFRRSCGISFWSG